MVVHSLDCDAGEGNRRRGRGRYYTEVQGYEACEAGGEIEDQSYYEKKEPDCGSEGTQESSTQDYKIWLIFRLGILSGMFFVLFAVLTVAAFKADKDIQWEPAFRMYRGLFLFILEFFSVWNQFVWLASCGDKSCAHMRLQKPSLSSSNLGVGRLFRCCLGRKCCSFHFLGSVWDPFLLASVSVGVFFSTFLHQHIECLLSTLQILASESSMESADCSVPSRSIR